MQSVIIIVAGFFMPAVIRVLTAKSIQDEIEGVAMFGIGLILVFIFHCPDHPFVQKTMELF